MANEIPLSGAGSTGILLPTEQAEILTNGLLRETGSLQLAGDAKTTKTRKTTFPIWKGKPTAAMVGEGQRKPVTGAEMGSTDLNIKKIASIVIFTDEQIDDLQNGDLNVLVDTGVREAIAEEIDAHAVGKHAGTNFTGGFDTMLRSSAATPVELNVGADDGLQLAVSAAMGQLEANGYANPANLGVLLTPGFNRLLRDATDADDSRKRLYEGFSDPLYGLQRALSTNLSSLASAAGAGKIVGFVVNKPNLHVRLRQDVTLKVSTDASIVLPDGTTQVNLYQDNLTAVRYETRIGFRVHDLDRAVVPIIDAS